MSATEESREVQDGCTVSTLAEMPRMRALYGRAIASSGRARVGALLPGGTTEVEPALPTVVSRIAGVDTGSSELIARLTAFQRLVREPGSDVLPACFLHLLGFPLVTAAMVRPQFPLPLLGMVHVANSATVLEPVRVGDRLEVRAWAQNLQARRGGVSVDLVTRIAIERDPTQAGSGQPATREAYVDVATYLARGYSLAGTTPAASAPPRPAFVPPTPTGRWVLSPGVGRAFAAISGDHNPIHTSVLGAKALGFSRAIAHGMYTASRALAEIGSRRGDRFEWSIRFAKPVMLPSTIGIAIVPSAQASWAPPSADDGWAFAGWSGSGPHFFGGLTPLEHGAPAQPPAR